MAVKEVERAKSSGLYPDLDELGADNTIVLFRIVDLDDEDDRPINKGKYGWNAPLLVDVLAIDQDEDGEVTGHRMWLRWEMKFGSQAMWGVRGHDKPGKDLKRSEVLALAKTGVNGPGDEIIGRLWHKTNEQSPKGYFVAFDKAKDADKAAILKVRESLGGDAWGADGDGELF